MYYLLEGAKLFGITKTSQIEGNENIFLKVRVLAAIAWKVITFEHKALGGQGKSRAEDERVFREQLALHVQKGEGKLRVFEREEIEAVMNCVSSGYFVHYLLLHNYRLFPRR